MARTCFLHIGMHKTGSTAIQSALDGYDDGRIRYLPLPMANHSLWSQYMFRLTGREAMIAAGMADDRAELAERGAILRAEVGRMMDAAPGDVILSAEELSARLLVDEVALVRDLVLAHCADVRIIAYVREPAGFMASAFQEVLRHHPAPFAPGERYPCYREMFEAWERVFGRARVTYVPYDRARLAGGDVVTDFASRVGIPPGRLKRGRSNAAMPAEAVARLFVMRRALAGPDLPPLARRLLSFGASRAGGFGSAVFAYDPSACDALLGEFADDVRWMEDRLGGPMRAAGPGAATLQVRDEAELVRMGRRLAPRFWLWLVGQEVARRLGLLRARTG